MPTKSNHTPSSISLGAFLQTQNLQAPSEALDAGIAEIAARTPDSERPLKLFFILETALHNLSVPMLHASKHFGSEEQVAEYLMDQKVLARVVTRIFREFRGIGPGKQAPEPFLEIVCKGVEKYGLSLESFCIEQMIHCISRHNVLVRKDYAANLLQCLVQLSKVVTPLALKREMVGDAVILGLPASSNKENSVPLVGVLEYVRDNLKFDMPRCQATIISMRSNKWLEEAANALLPDGTNGYVALVDNGVIPQDSQTLLGAMRLRPDAVLWHLASKKVSELPSVLTDTLLEVVLAGDWLGYEGTLATASYVAAVRNLENLIRLMATVPFISSRLEELRLASENVENLQITPAFLVSRFLLAECGMLDDMPYISHDIERIEEVAAALVLNDPHGILDNQRRSLTARIAEYLEAPAFEAYGYLKESCGWPEVDSIPKREVIERVCLQLAMTAATARELESENKYGGMDIPISLQFEEPRMAISKLAGHQLVLNLCRADFDLFAGAIKMGLLPDTYVGEASDRAATFLMKDNLGL
ncbi:hypothetical protein HNP46_000496 [Pseudomonas nitritireducens]|uniref:Uncharacterized protein n=1 Tax=Pseudomonas nitroreducens TaxID=46680 RepID=A0A7W7KF32_PSENT|nr:hypothetical protein [Pseudomonas nitritireducens]MBB4861685.1 hypothetical protein [Pseudomonas nitritireducens]